jgi:CheY-like chemotaxis protein
MELFVAHLKERPLEYGTAKIVGNVDDCVQALGELLDALLDLARLESGSIQPVLQATPVAELWKRLHGVFAEMASAKNLELRFHPTRLWVRTDPRLLHRIMLNLVSNAIRYTRTGGVLVACRRAGNHARLEVWDTGYGIAAEDLEEVFHEFVQLDNRDDHSKKGLGLGLSIVERTARLLDHRLRVRSVPGRGSCFSLNVPIADPAAATAPAAEAPIPSDRDGFAGSTVLVVEDDALARRALVDLLRSWRCFVREASTAEEAQQSLADGCRPDLIASDYRLSDRASGIDVIARIRATLGREVPAFIVSGDMGADVVAAAKAAGLLLLRKPVKAARLRRVLDLLLRSCRAIRD